MLDSYLTYRGRCEEMSKAAVAEDPTLTIVRGHYYCPFTNKNEQHWWTVRPDGSIFDPTKGQFLSNGEGEYTPFDGQIECDCCGKRVPEDEATTQGKFALCSYDCLCKLVLG